MVVNRTLNLRVQRVIQGLQLVQHLKVVRGNISRGKDRSYIIPVKPEEQLLIPFMPQPVVEIQALNVRWAFLQVMEGDSQPAGDGHLRHWFHSVCFIADGDGVKTFKGQFPHIDQFVVMVLRHFMDAVKNLS